MKKNALIAAYLFSAQPVSAIRRWLLLLWALCYTTVFLFSQNATHPSFRQYTTDDGLASPEVYHLLQDRDDFIWISTDNGVSRFDGYEFRNYGVKDGLLENVIFLMQLDSLGRVWMQSRGGNLYYTEGDTILAYWNNHILQNYKERADTEKGFIVEGAGEKVHIGTFKYGVLSISKDGTTTVDIQKEPIYRQVFEKNGIALNAFREQDSLEIVQAYTDQLSAQNLTSPIYFQTSQGQWSLSDLFYNKTEGYIGGGAFYLGDEKYLFQMYADVWFIDKGKVQWKHHFPHYILCARQMRNGELFVGLHYHKGLKVYKSIGAFQKDECLTWLTGQSVSYFVEDKKNGKWFATNESGVFYSPADAFMVHDTKTGLPDEKVTAVAVKNEEELFVGLGNGAVWQLNRNSGLWKALPEIPGNGNVRDLYFDQSHQQLWAGRDQLFYLKNKQWIVSKISSRGGTVSMSNRITQSPDSNRLWTCNHNGFISIDLRQNTIKDIKRGRDQRTYVVREDFSGKKWVGKPDGLYEWKDAVLYSLKKLFPAFSLRVEDIGLMPDSTLVVATKGAGLVFWKGKQFEQITVGQGLTADMLEFVHVDANGVTWAGTLNGLNRITGPWGKRQVEQITVFHGLPSNEINRVATYGDNTWIATNKGLVLFSNKIKNQFSSSPILSSVLANNLALNINEPIELHHKNNSLTIHFSAINYKMNGHIPYQYRMDKGKWVETFNRSLNFPELSPGKRLFEVEAQNEDGVWSEATALQLVIKPPWWKTWWAIAGAILAGALLVLITYKYRTGQVKKAAKIQLQIADLERSALQAQMNPHFIFNCLNSIQNYILQNKKDAAIMYLGSFASLVRSMLNASVSGNILLAEEINLLNNYLELEKLRFKSRFNFKVKAAEGLDVFEWKIPPLLVQPYVENAVLHGISKKTSGGKVEVLFDKKEGYIEVSITDNGMGFNLEKIEGNKNRAHKSFGMSITRNRLELLSNSKENNKVSTKVLKNKEGLVLGTQVIIRIGLTENLVS